MKKPILFLLAVLLLAGCDFQEKAAQLQAALYQKIAAVLSPRTETKPVENIPLPAEEPPLPPQLPEQKQPVEPSTQTLAHLAAIKNLPPRKHPIKAFLFTHADSPLCKKLKADQWAENFKQTYQGQVLLIEHDMKNPASREALQAQMRQRKLSSVSVPILFIGNSILPGYPFNGVEESVWQALSAPASLQAKRTAARRQTRKKQPEQFMEIIMEDTQKPVVKNAKASPRDSRAMQLALAGVEKNNQETLVDMGSLFGEDTKAQAYVIISRTERLLRNKAASSPDYKTYLATQKALLQLQEKQLNQLMQQNAKNLRAIRG